MNKQFEHIVKKAVAGDKKALETIVKEVQDMIYNLALRMLWHPEDAKDATQEILIRIITNLGKFEYQSQFKTWVYRIAANHCINYKNKHYRSVNNFQFHAQQLAENLSNEISYTSHEVEKKLLVEEAKVGCSNAMLQCLNQENRMIYILGEILEFNSTEGAEILSISPPNFRQKLSRCRKRLHDFLHANCGLVNSKNPCRCHKRVDHSIKEERIRPNQLLFIKNKKSETLIETIDHIQHAANLYHTNASYDSPRELIGQMKKLIMTTDEG